MGRKKKKVIKPWCWYCNREFEDEKILIQHQKAKHFKCQTCYKKLFTGPGLAIHCIQVHKQTIDKIPHAIPGRTSTEIEVYGMEGIPEADAIRHEQEKGIGGWEEPPNKAPRPDVPFPSGLPPFPIPPMPSGVGGMPPVPPPGMPPIPPFPGLFPPRLPPGFIPPPPPGGSSSSLPPLPEEAPLIKTPLDDEAPPVPHAFPAYTAPPAERAPTQLVMHGAGTKIIHPDEDISLEEHRARMARYNSRMMPSAVAGPPQKRGFSDFPPAGAGGSYPPPPQPFGQPHPPFPPTVNMPFGRPPQF